MPYALPKSPKMGPPWSPFTIITHDLMCMIALEKAKFITNLFEAVLKVLCLGKKIQYHKQIQCTYYYVFLKAFFFSFLFSILYDHT